MSEEENVQVEGAPWSNLLAFKTFEEADAIRKEQLLEEGTQAKVKCVSLTRFVVRVRQDLTIIQEKKTKKKTKKKK